MKKPEYFTYIDSNGIEFKAGDIVTCHYAGYFKIIGFFDYYCDISKTNIPQVIIEQLYDSTGKKRSGRKSCIAILKHALPEINKEINQLQERIKTLTHFKKTLNKVIVEVAGIEPA